VLPRPLGRLFDPALVRELLKLKLFVIHFHSQFDLRVIFDPFGHGFGVDRFGHDISRGASRFAIKIRLFALMSRF
jgi:hypothetical protein